MIKRFVLLIAVLCLILTVPVSAEVITDDFNISTTTAGSFTYGYSYYPSQAGMVNAYIYFTNTSAIAGFYEANVNGVTLLLNGPYVMQEGEVSTRVYLAGAGDSYDDRNYGTLTLTPISNVTGFDVYGNPQFSSTKCTISLKLTLDSPLVFKSGDTSVFRIYNATTNTYTVASIFPELMPGVSTANLPFDSYSVLISHGLPYPFATITMGDSTGSADRAIGTASGLYGQTGSMRNVKYRYQFENKVVMDSNALTFTVEKTPGVGWTYNNPTTLSQFNITDGTGYTYYYPLSATTVTGSVVSLPITINLMEPRLNTHFNRTYFSDTYLLSVLPSTGQLTDTYSAAVSSSSGTALSSIPGLYMYSLFEDYGTTQYDLAKDSAGIPITYVKSGSNWTRYSGNSSLGWVNIGSTLPASNSFVLSNDSALGTTGTRGFTAELVFNNGQSTQHLYDYITLTSSGNLPLSNTVNFTIIDSSTSAAIAGSTLSILQTTSASGPVSGAPWWNQTSATGKFSVSGLGTGGLQSLLFGDQIYAEGSAEGYVSNSLNLYIGSETIGSTQYIPLTLNEYAPGVGYFTAIYSAYDSTTSNAVSGVSVKQYCSGLTKIGTTNSAGIFSTYNNSVGTCSYTASKSGYTTITKFFNGTSQQILNIEIPMSSSSINPTVTATATTVAPTVNPTATGAEGAQNAIDLLGSYAYTFMVLGIFSVFMWLFWSVIYNMTGGNIITKILKRGRR